MFESFFGNQPKGGPANAAEAASGVRQQQQQPRVPNGPGQNANPGGTGNGSAPLNTNQTPQNANSPESLEDPVAMYADLWKESAPSSATEAPKFTLNPETVKKVTDSLDFTQNLPEELVEKIQAGEQFTPQDMMSMMNHVGRQAYARAMEHQSTLTGQFVNMHSEHSLKGIPELVKRQLTQNKVRSIPAAQSNPVVQEHMELIASKLAAKYPNASEEWIAEQTQEYFVNMAKHLKPDAFVPSKEERQRQEANPKGAFDWDAFMTEDRRNAA